MKSFKEIYEQVNLKEIDVYFNNKKTTFKNTGQISTALLKLKDQKKVERSGSNNDRLFYILKDEDDYADLISRFGTKIIK